VVLNCCCLFGVWANYWRPAVARGLFFKGNSTWAGTRSGDTKETAKMEPAIPYLTPGNCLSQINPCPHAMWDNTPVPQISSLRFGIFQACIRQMYRLFSRHQKLLLRYASTHILVQFARPCGALYWCESRVLNHPDLFFDCERSLARRLK